MPVLEGTTRTENEVFEEWRKAAGQEREELLRELVRLLQKHAYAICWTKLGDRRPDIVNHAVFKAVSKAAGFKGESKFSTWFHEIVVNLCNSALRQKQQRGIEHAPEDVEGELCVDPDMDSGIELERMLKDVSEEDRRFVDMKINGLNETEIAEA